MTVPICPRHKTPMRAGKFPGSWYCSKKDGDSWCKERAKDGQPQPDPVQYPSQKAQEGPYAALTATNGWDLAFRLAGEVYKGTGKAAEALELAAAARALLP